MSDESQRGWITGLVTPLVIGPVLLGGGGYVYRTETAALESSQPIDAVVADTHVDRQATAVGVDNARTAYYPVVTYTDEVAGVVYESSNLKTGVGRSGMSQGTAESTLERSPPSVRQ